MAIKFLSGLDISGSIDLQKNELKNAVMHSLALAPSNPVEGQMYWNSASGTKKLYIYDADGSAWVDITGDLTSLSSGAKNTMYITSGSGGDAVIELNHLGIEDLVPPVKNNVAQDAIMFYDASGSGSQWLTPSTGTGIRINGTSLELYEIPNASLENDSVTVTKGNGLTSTSGGTMALGGSVTITVGQGTGIAVEANAVALKNHAALGANTLMMWDDTNGQLTDSVITQDATTSAITIGDDLIVSGDLTVQGSLTSIETTNTAITDNVIVLNKGETGAGVSSTFSGFEVDRGTESNVSFLWDDVNDRWQVGGKLKLNTIPLVSNVANVLIEEDVAGAGEIRKVGIQTLKNLMGGQNMSLILEASGGVKPAGALWVTKSGNTYTVEHYLGTKRIIAQVMDATTGETVMVDVARTTDDEITVAFAGAVTDGDYILNLQVVKPESHGDGGGASGTGGQL
jgi:hypothetical protein